MRDSKGQWNEHTEAALARHQRYRALFLGHHRAYLVSATESRPFSYITVNWLGDRLTRRMSELVLPSFPKLTAAGGNQADVDRMVETLRLPELVEPASMAVSYAGRAAWKVYWSRAAGAPALRLWGANPGELAVFDYWAGDPAAPYAVNFWYVVTRKNESYRIRERYEVQVGAGAAAGPRPVRATNAAFSGDGSRPVPLAQAWPDQETRPPEETVWHLTSLPGYPVDNPDVSGNGAGDSDYTESLISIQKSLNLLVAQRAAVITLTEFPVVDIPAKMIRPDGTVDISAFWLHVQQPGENDVTPVKISNWDGNLEKSAQQWEKLDREFRNLTPLNLDADAGVGSGESGTHRRLVLLPTEVAVNRRRPRWVPALGWAIRTAQELARGMGADFGQPVRSVRAEWPEAIPEDPEAVSRQMTSEYREGILSLETAVRRTNPERDDVWVQEELARIRADAAERRATAVPDLGNPFGGAGDTGGAAG